MSKKYTARYIDRRGIEIFTITADMETIAKQFNFVPGAVRIVYAEDAGPTYTQSDGTVIPIASMDANHVGHAALKVYREQVIPKLSHDLMARNFGGLTSIQAAVALATGRVGMDIRLPGYVQEYRDLATAAAAFDFEDETDAEEHARF